MSYRVTTWDHERGEFTPQDGLKSEPYSKWELRSALRSLRRMGYDVNRCFASSVLVERIESLPFDPLTDPTGAR